MKWYFQIKAILDREPEDWLAYLHGRKIDVYKPLFLSTPRFKGAVFLILAFFRFALRQTRFPKGRSAPAFENGDEGPFLIYAGSLNQAAALSGTLRQLRADGRPVWALAKPEVAPFLDSQDGYLPLTLNAAELFQASVVMIGRSLTLKRRLRRLNPLATRYFLDRFLRSYLYLVRFRRVLLKVRPRYVVVANDHNVDNRSLLAVAHFLGVKTVYLQHASVTSIFPALRVNYAFLDGVSALETYRGCEPNLPASARGYPLPEVFLSGQKKPLLSVQGEAGRRIGLAVNAVDRFAEIDAVVRPLLADGHQVVLRWHPRQPPSEIRQYRAEYGDLDNVFLSNPQTDGLADFLSRIAVLVAGNSSILLEAALTGRNPVYFEFDATAAFDYYGYVESGLALNPRDIKGLCKTLHDYPLLSNEQRSAVRYYSHTFGTEFEGGEGALVAECLERLKDGSLPSELFGYTPFDMDTPAPTHLE